MKSKTIFFVFSLLMALTLQGIAQEVSEKSFYKVKLVKTVEPPSLPGKNEYIREMEFVGDHNIYLRGKKTQFFVIIGSNVSYYDEHTQLIEEKSYAGKFDRSVVSKDGRHIFLWNIKQKRCRMETIEDELIWEREMPERLSRYTSNFNPVQVTIDGKVILPIDGCSRGSLYTYRGCEGDGLAVFDSTGNLIDFGEIKNSDLEEFHGSNDVSSDGNYLAVNYIHARVGSYLRFYDLKELKELWFHKFKTKTIGGVAVSPNGKYVVAATGASFYERKEHSGSLPHRSIHFIKGDGTIIREINCQELGSLAVIRAISPDGNYVTLVGRDDQTKDACIYLFYVPTGELLWKYGVKQGGVFGPVSLSKGAEIIASECHSPDGLFLYLFNKDGKVIFKDKALGGIYENAISYNGKGVWSIDGQGKVYHYQVER